LSRFLRSQGHFIISCHSNFHSSIMRGSFAGVKLLPGFPAA
jgi:hypothetical protein